MTTNPHTVSVVDDLRLALSLVENIRDHPSHDADLYRIEAVAEACERAVRGLARAYWEKDRKLRAREGLIRLLGLTQSPPPGNGTTRRARDAEKGGH